MEPCRDASMRGSAAAREGRVSRRVPAPTTRHAPSGRRAPRPAQRLLKRRPHGAGLEPKSAPLPPRVWNYTTGTELDAAVHDGWRRQSTSRGRPCPTGSRELDPEVASTSNQFRTGSGGARAPGPRQDAACVGVRSVELDGAAARRAKVAPGEATVGSR